MKIDLDLSDIYSDEEGNSLRPEFVDVVVHSIVNRLNEQVKKEIQERVNKAINDLIITNLNVEIPKIINNFLDYEYEEVSSWGEKKGKWTVRDRIAKELKDATGFDRKDYWDKNKETPFTKVIKNAVEEQIKPMTRELYEIMNADFKKECIKEAARHLTETYKKA